MSTTTKQDLANYLAGASGMNKGLAMNCVEVLFEGLAESIVQGNRIEVRGFGVWEVTETNSGNRRNPRTGERVFVPRRRKVMFKPGKMLKGAFRQAREKEV